MRLAALQRDLGRILGHLDQPVYFSSRLPANEQWRLFKQYRPRTAYLDIETTVPRTGLILRSPSSAFTTAGISISLCWEKTFGTFWIS